MRYYILITFLICTSAIYCSAQDPTKPIKWLVRSSADLTIPFSKTNYGYITDNLSDNNVGTFGWQIISFTRFISNWGLEMSFTANFNPQQRNSFNRFSNSVNAKYSDRYLADISSGCIYNDPLNIEKFSLGPVYQLQKRRIIYIFRFLIGTTSFDTNLGSAILKEKGTNTILDIHWTPGSVPNDYLTLNPSITAGYRVTKRLFLNLDLNYWIYNMDFTYTETIKDINSKNIITTDYHYRDLVNELNIGIGLMIKLK